MPESQAYALLVDDDEIAQFLHRRLLDKLGVQIEIVEANDGSTAVEMIEARGRPEFVLLDVRMPRMDGHDVLAWLQGTESPPRTCMVSSSCLESDIEKALAYPFVDAYLEKPLTQAGLLETLSHIQGFLASYCSARSSDAP